MKLQQNHNSSRPLASAAGAVLGLPLTAAHATAGTGQTSTVATGSLAFIIPASPKEGRDPFFPESARPYQMARAAAARWN